ncbi:MAG: NAD(P)-dependent oxidoreductase [Clostridia bacterium]|nr:NAD(P)-dependent oxidoreductase [Clostridia bacterium]
MKIFIIGGTGLLGSMAAFEFCKKGDEVTTISLPGLPKGANFPQEMKIIEGNYHDMSDEQLLSYMTGFDGFVFAAGVDERGEFPAPIYDAYYKHNVAPVKRFLSIAKQAGIKKAVILGSYFSFFDRLYPEYRLCETSPYIRSRREQQEAAFALAEEGKLDVCVLELPYIFGTQPGRRPVCTVLISRILKMGPATFYPTGGTAMITARQVGQVIEGALKKNTGAHRYPIGMYNRTWDEYLKIVHKAMGQPKRPVIHIPQLMFNLYADGQNAQLKKNGCEMGIDPKSLGRLMYLNTFIDPDIAMHFGATPDDIDAAIIDSITVSVKACKGESELMDMRTK